MPRVLLVCAFALLVVLPSSAVAKTKWLCAPGLKGDACDVGLATTVFSPAGERLRVERPKPGPRKIDCFYVYPTVSDQQTTYANKRIDPEIRSIAEYQAARYTRECRVFAPVYRQTTIAGIQPGVRSGGARRLTTDDRAQGDIREAWRTYLRRHNRGRGVVLIGHSQGTFRLRQLIAKEIDDRPKVRRRIVSAILLGGNVVRGEFDNLPACRTEGQLGCVIAFSTYDETPPDDALFGRTANGRVLCTNPAQLAGGAAEVDLVFPSRPFAPGTLIATGIALLGVEQPTAPTPWVEVEDGYEAECVTSGDNTFLKLTPDAGSPDFKPSPTPQWGLHLVDGNVALDDLLATVRRQAAAFARRR